MTTVKLQDKFHIGSPPGIDRLVRISHNKQIFMIPGQNICKSILILVNILELIDHDVLQSLLPFLPYIGIMFQYI